MGFAILENDSPSVDVAKAILKMDITHSVMPYLEIIWAPW